MEITCEKNSLSTALSLASKAINSRSPLPILSHILMRTENQNLKIAATDLDLGISLELAVESIDSGAVACPSKLLNEIISKLPSQPVRFRSHYDGRLELSCGRSRFEISTLPAEEFPSMPKFSVGKGLSVPQKLLKMAIKRVILAVAQLDESRTVMMTGVLLRKEGQKLLLVGTDGRRMSYQCIAIDSDLEFEPVIVPGRAMQELSRLLGETNEPVDLLFSDGQVFCRLNDPGQGLQALSLHCRLLDGVFPDYRKVLPSGFTRKVRVGRDPLLSALQRMLILAQEKLSPNLVLFEIEEEMLRISAHTPDLGVGSEEVNVCLEGDALKIAFNGRYIVDVLGHLDCEEVVIEFQDDSRSAQISIADSEDFRYVIMPVKLREPAAEEASASVA